MCMYISIATKHRKQLFGHSHRKNLPSLRLYEVLLQMVKLGGCVGHCQVATVLATRFARVALTQRPIAHGVQLAA